MNELNFPNIGSFLEQLKTDDNSNLIECISAGYKACFESVEDATADLYHVTYYNRLSSIAEIGLVSGCHRSIGSSAYDDHCKGKIFLCSRNDLALWAQRAEEFADYNSDDPLSVGLAPVVLRLEVDVSDELQKDIENEDSYYITESVAPDELVVWNGSAWIPVDQYDEIDISQSFDEDGAYFARRNPLTTI